MARKPTSTTPPSADPGKPPQPADLPRPEKVKQIEALFQSVAATAAAIEPYFGKLTPEQSDRLVADTELLSQRQWAAERLSWFLLAGAVLLGVVALCFVWTVSLYYDKADLVSDLIKMIGGLLGGLLGGYGLRGTMERKRKPGPQP